MSKIFRFSLNKTFEGTADILGKSGRASWLSEFFPHANNSPSSEKKTNQEMS